MVFSPYIGFSRVYLGLFSRKFCLFFWVKVSNFACTSLGSYSSRFLLFYFFGGFGSSGDVLVMDLQKKGPFRSFLVVSMFSNFFEIFGLNPFWDDVLL